MFTYLFSSENLNNLKNFFFNIAECTGNTITRESIEEAGKTHSNSFIECHTIKGRDTICVHIEKIEPTISDNNDLIDRIKFFYQEPASPTGQAVKPFTELTKMVEELSKKDKLSSKLTIYSPSEFKFNFDWWENFTQIISTYHIPFSISFIFILIPLLYSLYKQMYLLLTYLLPEWKKKYPVFFANHKKLDKFVSDLMKNPEKLHLLRIGLSFSSLYSGVASFFLISYTFKLLAQILKKLT